MQTGTRWIGIAVVFAAVAVWPASQLAVAAAHEEGTLKLADRRLAPGTSIQIMGEKFARGSRLKLALVGVAGRFELGEVETDTAGAFTKSFDLATDLTAGSYRLVAIAPDGDEAASLTVEVLVAAQPAEEASMPNAGRPPTAEPLALDRAGSPWVTGGAVVGIIFAFVLGGFLLRRSQASD